MFVPKTDLQIKYILDSEYIFEQMMPPGASFGSYRYLSFFEFHRKSEIVYGPKDKTSYFPDKPGSFTWYLQIIWYPTYTIRTMDYFLSLFRKERWDTQIVENEYCLPQNIESQEFARYVLHHTGKILEEGEDENEIYHVIGYIYLKPIKARDTRYFDKDDYKYICQIPVYCEFVCLEDKIKVRCHGIPTGLPDKNGHAKINDFKYTVMADTCPAYRAQELIRKDLISERKDGVDLMALRKKERHAYNLEYTALKAIPSFLVFPLIYVFVYMRNIIIQRQPEKIFLYIFISCLVVIPVLLSITALLHQKYKQMIAGIHNKDNISEDTRR